ncbi:dehydration-responsive element-binding protein 1H [Brachypodium distachyon]|uniref:dehydration-responsive element-binding protein 1H n=1 Tax=Brachypodium distachyon TaxID=15368 RepID=UPI000234F4E2|nr:dehydration-responsive element-binding protein 1H [Brachypodium distachyon]|eukprot:XP_003578465.1 dehydration-responsive element-binding protein 1H [Brachypodium distachyon]
MAMDGSDQRISSASSSSSYDQYGVVWSPPPKRPAGRTKFKETRHPVYRGVRRRGSAGRWVCEVRVPGMRNKRLWLGTHLTAESAGRAHDAAMLALRGPSAAAKCLLNFPDSAWLLAVTPSSTHASLDNIQRAALAAVADFQRQEANNVAVANVGANVPIASMAPVDNAGPPPSFRPSAAGMFEAPVAMGSDMFELDMPDEMDLGMYYTDLAEGLLMEPPPPAPDAGACWESGDCGNGGADASLWSY